MYEIVSCNEWGNCKVRCPHCKGVYKEDGINKHISQMHKGDKWIDYK